MAEYHVGCGITGIFAGTLNKKGDMWLHKSDVTSEAFSAVAQHCLEYNVAMKFDYKGKRYKLAVTEIKAESKGQGMTQKEIDDAIKKCRWLSDNSNLIGGICRSKCLPCRRVIEKGECETLIKLLNKSGRE